MTRKILIISPTPTHPTNAGNRVRILNMASYLISLGHEVHFLYSRQENADEEAMGKFWGDRFHPIDYRKPELTLNQKRKRALLQRINKHYLYYCTVDEHYNEFLDDEIKKLDTHFHFDAVLVEYIFLSRAFLNFGPDVLKVIDTHDVMTDRHKLFLREGKKPVWYSTPFGQEKKGIRRADVVIAIQEKEKAHFRRMTGKMVVNVGHIVKKGKSCSESPRKKLLFVGSDNPSNLYGIIDFIEKDFPEIRKAFPDLELLIAGNICNRLEKVPENIRLLGEVADLSEAYDQADLVINPLTIGTGLKIKMIEAMGLSKVVFSTPVGAEGLESSAGHGYILYHDTEELIGGLKAVFNIQLRYTTLCNKAADVAESWNRENGSWLKKVFSGNDREETKIPETGDANKPATLQRSSLKEIIQHNADIHKFLIVSIPRSGSNMMVGMLSSHRNIVCYPELFHPYAIFDGGQFAKNNIEPYTLDKRNEDPPGFLGFIYSLRFRKSAQAIGFKMFPDQDDDFLRELILEPSLKKIVLIRDNYLMNFVSQKTAQKSKVYFVKSGTGTEQEDIRIEVDWNEFLAYEKRFQAFFDEVRDLLNKSGQEFCEIHYEQLLVPEHQARMLKFIEVEPDPGLLQIRSEKQNKLPPEDKILNYEELKKLLIESGREHYLEDELKKQG